MAGRNAEAEVTLIAYLGEKGIAEMQYQESAKRVGSKIQVVEVGFGSEVIGPEIELLQHVVDHKIALKQTMILDAHN